MIQEIKLENLKSFYDPEATYYLCLELPPGFVMLENYRKCLIFIPHSINELKSGLMSEMAYEESYRAQLRGSASHALMEFIKEESKNRNIYLVVERQDGILLDMIENIK